MIKEVSYYLSLTQDGKNRPRDDDVLERRSDLGTVESSDEGVTSGTAG